MYGITRITLGRHEDEAVYYYDGHPGRLTPHRITGGWAFYLNGTLVVQYTTNGDRVQVQVGKDFAHLGRNENGTFDTPSTGYLAFNYAAQVGEYIVNKLTDSAKKGESAKQLLGER